jgi:hypothetical protein
MSNELDKTKFKKCSCGADVENEEVTIRNHYTLMGWFWWTMGTTAIPKSISFTCNNCVLKFEEITDVDLIKYHMYFRKH